MAKLKDDAIEADDLEEYLSTQDSFALELRVLETAHLVGFLVAHGGSYIDPTLKKHRQFDLRAKFTHDNNAIALAIECKSLQKNCPLLVSRIPRSQSESFHEVAFLHQLAGSRFPSVTHRGLNETLYFRTEMVGKSLAQVGRTLGGGWTDTDAELHDKWTQAVNSSIDLVHAALNTSSTVARTAVIPCLVISDDTLWAVDYDSEGAVKAKPSRVDEVTFFVGRRHSTLSPPLVSFEVSHLHIFTEKGFKERLRQIAEREVWWTELFG